MMIDESLAPVILFVFNRPEHTKATLKALSENILIENTVVHVFADGHKNNTSHEDKAKIYEVRNIIKENSHGLNIVKHFSDLNKGLANSVMNGVSEIINKFGHVIVLEDDLVCSKYFIQYMNECLSLFRKNKNVMHVGGYSPEMKLKLKKDTYSLSFASSWGWATWKDRWDLFMVDPREIIEEIERRDLKRRFDFHDSYPFFDMLKRQDAGEIDSWAIRWNGTVFLNEGLGVYPVKSLVRNIGFDGSGVHSGSGNWYDVKLANNSKPIVELSSMEENALVRKKMEQFFTDQNRITFWNKVKQKIKYEIKKAKGSSH